jgi:hypothetical protein
MIIKPIKRNMVSVNSVFVLTAASKNDEDDVLGYELLRMKDEYSMPLVLKELQDSNMIGERSMLVSSESRFPEDVQATMEPYFDRADLNHRLNTGSSSTENVAVNEVRVHMKVANGDEYLVQELDSGSHYITKDNQPVIEPPENVTEKIKKIFSSYEPIGSN